MSREIVLDAGPLVALLYARDPHHEWVRAQWEMIESPLLTWQVVETEACFLARRLVPRRQAKVLESVRRGALDLSIPLAGEIDAVTKLVAKYCDVRMSLRDLGPDLGVLVGGLAVKKEMDHEALS